MRGSGLAGASGVLQYVHECALLGGLLTTPAPHGCQCFSFAGGGASSASKRCPRTGSVLTAEDVAANEACHRQTVSFRRQLRFVVIGFHSLGDYEWMLAFEPPDVAEVVDRAQAEIYDVTEGRMSEDFVQLEDLLQPTMDEIDAIASNGGLARGVPTGFTELDDVTNGLHPGQMVIVAARPGVGKALALNTPLPTPTARTPCRSRRRASASASRR